MDWFYAALGRENLICITDGPLTCLTKKLEISYIRGFDLHMFRANVTWAFSCLMTLCWLIYMLKRIYVDNYTCRVLRIRYKGDYIFPWCSCNSYKQCQLDMGRSGPNFKKHLQWHISNRPVSIVVSCDFGECLQYVIISVW